jgi:hypothetical protein
MARQAKVEREAYSAFFDAHERGDLKAVKQLLARTPELERDRSNMDTWLHHAAGAGHGKLVKFWLDRGIPVDENVLGYSARDGLASPLVRSGNADAAKVLIAAGANVNAWCRYGGTPLHRAAQLNDPDFVNVLLKAGADPNVVNADGLTPLAHAMWGKWRKSEKALRDAGASEKGHKPAKQAVPDKSPRIDLRKDAKKIDALLKNAVKRFADEHSRDAVTAVALSVSGIEGYVIVSFDTKETRLPWNHHSSPWDASHSEYATENFDDWRYAYELAERGVDITAIDGKRVNASTVRGDKGFQRPFFDACVTVLERAAEAGRFDALNSAPTFTIGVEVSSGDHARFWQPRRAKQRRAVS